MTTTATATRSDFKPAPADTHIARCYRVIDLGTQYQEKYDKSQRKVLLAWELPEAQFEYEDKDGNKKKAPFVVSNIYTLSLNEKAHLRHHLESWRGRPFTAEELRGFDVKNVLGSPCMLTVVHHEKDDGTVRAVVNAVTKLHPKLSAPDQINTSQYFDVDNPDMEIFESLSDGLKNMIKRSEEWNKDSKGPESREQPPGDYYGSKHPNAPDDPNDDIPF